MSAGTVQTSVSLGSKLIRRKRKICFYLIIGVQLVALFYVFFSNIMLKANSGILVNYVQDNSDQFKDSVNHQTSISCQASKSIVYNQCEKDTVIRRPQLQISKYVTTPKFIRNHTGQNLLCMTPPKPKEHFKNPCWFDADDRFRCLPNFYVIGVCKCGTTDLYHRIAAHPDVLVSYGNKEIRWWTQKRFGFYHRFPKTMVTFDEYLDLFAMNAIRKDPAKITGDFTPTTFWEMHYWRYMPENNQCADEPKYTIPHVLKHVQPGAKLILILRNPTDRLWSDYLMRNAKKGLSQDDFHTKVFHSIKLFQNCTKEETTRACIYKESFFSEYPVKLLMGMYGQHMEEWLSVYPKNRILILRSEDYGKSIRASMESVYNYLELPPLSEYEMDAVANRSRSLVKKVDIGPMFPKTRKVLTEFYSFQNQKLATLLNDERFLWHDGL